MKKKILWVSRHVMTQEQYDDLVRFYGEIEMQVLDCTVQDVCQILDIAADVYAVVLPLELVAELKEQTDAEILIPVSERVPSGKTVYNPASGQEEAEYVFKHLHWKRVNRIDLEMEILKSDDSIVQEACALQTDQTVMPQEKIRKKVFMTVIGTGNYKEIGYYLNDAEHSVKNRFVQKALLNLLQERGEQFDKVVVFLTKEAEAQNWEQYIRRDREGKITQDEGFKPFLENLGIPVETVSIPSGNQEEDIFTIFKAMYQQMKPNENEELELTFDITHGFRILPLLFFPVLRYAKALNPIAVKAIYYGMYIENQDTAPIIDLQKYDVLMDWANAAHSFAKHGNADELKQCYDDLQKTLSNKGKQEYANATSIANRLYDLSLAVQACSGGDGKRSISASAKILQKNVTQGDIQYPFAEIMEPLMEYAVDAVRPLMQSAEAPVALGMATVDWCVKNGWIQQAYTALEETFLTKVCCSFGDGKRYLDREYREKVIKAAIFYVSRMDDENGVSSSEGLPDIVEEEREQFFNVVSHVSKKASELMFAIGEVRNQINHFGMRKSCGDTKNLKSKLLEFIAKVKAQFAAWDAETEA